MDYEKKYKDALERAKRWADGTLMPPDDSPKTVAVVIFPELTESEDERMVRKIESFLSAYGADYFSNDEWREIEVWLEKQKELFKSGRGLYYYDGEKTTFCGYLITEETPYDFAMSQQEEKQKEPQNKSMAHEDCSWSGILTSPLCKDKNLDDIAQEYVERVKEYNPTPDWNLIHTAVCYGYHLADQKEQKPDTRTVDDLHLLGFIYDLLAGLEWSKDYAMSKDECLRRLNDYRPQRPAEWSDTDNIGWDEAFACVTRAEKSAKNEEELQNAVTAEKWLKEIKFKYCVHPVKQEWSEEDEKVIRDACCWIAEYAGFLMSENKYKAEMLWKLSEKLKSLRPQQNQEWSEEDEHKLKLIKDCLVCCQPIPGVDGHEVELLVFLDSLRPQPKVEWSEDFDKEVESVHKRYPEVSFAKLTRIAYHFAKWADKYKSTEWSEEDERILKGIIGLVDHDQHYGVSNKDMIAWLKSLRPQPHWKPSEEQMKALDYAIAEWDGGKKLEGLYSLRNDLKKL